MTVSPGFWSNGPIGISKEAPAVTLKDAVKVAGDDADGPDAEAVPAEVGATPEEPEGPTMPDEPEGPTMPEEPEGPTTPVEAEGPTSLEAVPVDWNGAEPVETGETAPEDPEGTTPEDPG